MGCSCAPSRVASASSPCLHRSCAGTIEGSGGEKWSTVTDTGSRRRNCSASRGGREEIKHEQSKVQGLRGPRPFLRHSTAGFGRACRGRSLLRYHCRQRDLRVSIYCPWMASEVGWQRSTDGTLRGIRQQHFATQR